MDVREGGRSHVAMASPEFGTLYNVWPYTEVVPPERLEYVSNPADAAGNVVDPAAIGMPPDFPTDQRHVVVLEALGPNRTAMTVTEYGWKPGQMMEMSRMGLEQCLDKMEAYLSGR